MHFFYAPDMDPGATTYQLNEKESHHILHVLRSQPGDTLELTNGKGMIFHAVISEIHKKTCTVIITSSEVKIRTGPDIHLAIAPVKTAARLDFLLEKITECGVRTCSFIVTQNSERRKVETAKEEQTMIAAIKQSGSAFLPQLNPMMDFKKFILSKKNSQQKYIGHCRTTGLPPLAKCVQPVGEIVICIGPEGDFTEEEVSFAASNGFAGVSLSDQVLRTETAAIAAVNCVQTIYQLAL